MSQSGNVIISTQKALKSNFEEENNVGVGRG